MFSLNRIQLIGYQTQAVTVRKTPQGTSVTDLNIVAPYTYRTEGGQELIGRSYHVVTLWGGMADVAAQFVRAGSQLFIAGRLQTDAWEDEKTGEKRSKTKVVAQEMIFLDPKDKQHERPTGVSGRTLQLLNRADVIGNLTRDPEMRTTTSGQNVLSLGVATNERWKDKATGEMKERTEFHTVVVWGELAKEAAQVLRKGNRVFASGRVQTRSWETQAGVKRYTTEIVAETVSLLGVCAEGIDFSSEGVGAIQSQDMAPPSATESPSSPVDVPVAMPTSEIRVEDLPF
ncbi:single-stranded DNA-binding protein [Candidatus Peregrinibacteria bacterium]|nr:single-stranded DNA-binding protein [Candidatus Peregrinibacteria bacterium]